MSLIVLLAAALFPLLAPAPASAAPAPTVPTPGHHWLNAGAGIDSLWSEMRPAPGVNNFAAALPTASQGNLEDCRTAGADVLTAWQYFPDSEPEWSRDPRNPLAGMYNAARVCYSKLPGRVKVKWIEYAQFQYGCNRHAAAMIAMFDWNSWADPMMWSRITGQGVAKMSMDTLKAATTGAIKSTSAGGCLMNAQWVNHQGIGHFGPVLATKWDATIGNQSIHWTDTALTTTPALFDNTSGFWWGLRRVQASEDQPVQASNFITLSAYDQAARSQNQQVSGNFDCCYSLNGTRNQYHENVLIINISSDVPAYTPPPSPPADPVSIPTPPEQPPATPPPPAPPVDNAPTGSFSTAAFTANWQQPFEVRVTGTAADAQSSSVGISFYEPASGQWVGRLFSGQGQFNGTVVVPSYTADHRICAVVENAGWQGPALNRFLGCLDPDRPPTGVLGGAEYTGNGFDVRFAGFASDVDRTIPLTIDLITDDGVIQARTTTGNPNMAWIYQDKGFEVITQIPMRYMGLRVCAWARDWGGHRDTQLGCLIPKSTPIGAVDSVTSDGLNRFVVNGWAYQPRLSGSAMISVTAGGKTYTTWANAARPDVNVAFPGLGDARGFAIPIELPGGNAFNVCVTVLNQLGANGKNRDLGCQSVENNTPVGSLDNVKRTSPMTFNLTGWTVDPTTTWSTFMDVWIDPGTSQAAKLGHFSANEPRADLAAAWSTGINSAYGGNHGFNATVTVPGTTPTGPHTLCAYGVTWNRPEDNRVISCRVINVDADSSPVGGLDTISPVRWVNGAPVMNVAGWALDPDLAATAAGASLDIHLYWDGSTSGYPYPGAANLNRPDLAPTYQGWGLDHGFNVNVPMPTSAGPHELCAWAINKMIGKNTKIGCQTITAPGHDPFGGIDTVSNPRWSNGPVYQVAGWAIDADGTLPTGIDVWWDPGTADALKVTNLPIANQARADVEAAHPGYGTAHGFTVNVPPPDKPGVHQLCAYGLNLAGTAGTSGTLGCRTVTTTGHDPGGALDLVQPGFNGSRGIRVSGWAIDPDTTGTASVHIYVDGVGRAILTDVNKPRSDLWMHWFGWGPNHGFDTVIGGVGPGTHEVCAYGINIGAGTTNPQLGCKTITLGSDPWGAFEVAAKTDGAPTALTVAGWTVDPDTDAPLAVHVYVDGVQVGVVTANIARTDVGAAYVGYGNGHGFNASIAGALTGFAAGTSHAVCTYAISVTATGATDGHNPRLGECRTVVI